MTRHRQIGERLAFAATAITIAITAASCGESSRTVNTAQGSYVVPGPARFAGAPGSIGFIQVQTPTGPCESAGFGGQVQATRVRTTEGRTEVYVTGIYGCNAGWVDARHIVPANAPAAPTTKAPAPL